MKAQTHPKQRTESGLSPGCHVEKCIVDLGPNDFAGALMDNDPDEPTGQHATSPCSRGSGLTRHTGWEWQNNILSTLG